MEDIESEESSSEETPTVSTPQMEEDVSKFFEPEPNLIEQQEKMK